MYIHSRACCMPQAKCWRCDWIISSWSIGELVHADIWSVGQRGSNSESSNNNQKKNNNNDSATSNNKKWILVFSNNFLRLRFCCSNCLLTFCLSSNDFCFQIFLFFWFQYFFYWFPLSFSFFCFCFSHIYSFGLILFCNNMFNTRKWPLTVRLHNNELCRLLFHAA